MKKKISVFLVLINLLFLSACEDSSNLSKEESGEENPDFEKVEKIESNQNKISKEEEEVNKLAEKLFDYKTNYRDDQIQILGFNQDYINSEMDGENPKIIKIPSEIESMEVIEIVADSFENKGIKEVDFTYAENLHRVDGFEGNELTELDFTNANKLEIIKGFNKNNIKHVNVENLENLERISALAFSENQIEELKFKNNHQLKELSVGSFSDNELTELNLSEAINLEKISNTAFFNNYISKIDFGKNEASLEIDSSAFQNNGPKSNAPEFTWYQGVQNEWLIDNDLSWYTDSK